MHTIGRHKGYKENSKTRERERERERILVLCVGVCVGLLGDAHTPLHRSESSRIKNKIIPWRRRPASGCCAVRAATGSLRLRYYRRMQPARRRCATRLPEAGRGGGGGGWVHAHLADPLNSQHSASRLCSRPSRARTFAHFR